MNQDNAQPIIAADDEPRCNGTSDSCLGELIERRYGRREVMQGGLAATLGSLVAGTSFAQQDPAAAETALRPHPRRRLNPDFTAVPAVTPGREDQVVVPEGYAVQVLLAEGTPLTATAAPYIPGDHNSGADREQQAGAHHDGMYFFPLARGAQGNKHGVLCINHENIDQALIHPNGFTRGADGTRPVEDEVRKEIASHGVSVVELVKPRHGDWQVVRGRLNRRITVQTRMELTGPARGSNLLKTRYSPHGTRTRGTLNNCANGHTPWGTYLTCEENWAGYFFNTATNDRPREHARYGVPSAAAATYGWGTRPEDQYARFNATPTTADFYDMTAARQDYRNEPNTFGWVIEIDPLNPRSTPKKRTALGRFAHEGAWVAPVRIGQPVVVYMGDDGRGEYLYKFVSTANYWPWEADGDKYLDAGTLYVARFNEDGSGTWIALELGSNGLTPQNGFADQADILINARSAADYVRATPMDRPEWATVDERSGFVYLTLTNNSNRGASASQPLDAANPRRGNPDGHIIRWREAHDEYCSTEFLWDIFAFAGPTLQTVQTLGATAPYNADPAYAAQVFPGTRRRSYLGETAHFNSPDGLWSDPLTGLLWIQTDGYSSAARGFGNQQMLVANPDSGVVKRFLVGPRGCEITGITTTPDRRTVFVNIQHPDGQWPNLDGETRPRSATLAITRDDGGVVGT